MTDKYARPEYGTGVEAETNHILTFIANELAIRNSLKVLEMEYESLDSYGHEEFKNKIKEITEDD